MIQGKREGQLGAVLETRQHKVHADVSLAQGGTDAGMNPHELLEASLAACTTITVQMYAKRKGYKLDSTHVIVKIESEGATSRISRAISFTGDLTEDEKARLMEIAEKCPIHKLLTHPITVESRMLDE